MDKDKPPQDTQKTYLREPTNNSEVLDVIEGKCMRVLLRADASPLQGTGHVTRCLALSEELVSKGHEAYLLTNNSNIEWLEELIEQTNVFVLRTEQHNFSKDICEGIGPDWVVVDSYEISPTSISHLSSQIKLLAIIDGDTRGIVADYYLDQNLDAEIDTWPLGLRNRMWAGSDFTLVREDFLMHKRERPWELRNETPHLVAFMGGTDPTGAIVDISRALTKLHPRCTATVVVQERWMPSVTELIGELYGIEIIKPTSELPALLATADIVVSASGTSTWDLLSMGIPSILVAVVENQLMILNKIRARNLALGVNRSRGGEKNVAQEIERMALMLFRDKSLREKLSRDCLRSFNGAGKSKIVEKLEANL